MISIRGRRGARGTLRPQLEPLEDRCLPSGSAGALSQLPLTFEANQGQADAAVRYLAHGSGYNLALTDSGATLALRHGAQQDLLRLQFVGANATSLVSGLDAQAGQANYLLGNDPSQWHTGVPLFGQVAYQRVYPGIDVVFYGNDQQQLEYDLDLAPGADPSQVRLRFDGAQGLTVDNQGNLVVQLTGGSVVQQAPVVYQQNSSGGRTAVAGRFGLRADGTVGLQLGGYDAAQALVIDPVLVYSTYLGGSGGDLGNSIAVDSSGNAYITGYSGSSNFPTASPSQQASTGGLDGFVAKLNAAGALVYATYLGGSDTDFGTRIAVDDAGNACIVGSTSSTNFPTLHPLQATSSGGGADAFVIKLNAAGAPVYSTYLGGSGYEAGNGIALDAAGNAYVTGYTESADFPTAGTIGSIAPNNKNTFVVKLNPAGSALVYSLLVGGSGDTSGNVIAVDTAGNAYITGYTTSTNFPVSPNAVQPHPGGGGWDAFVSKVNATGSGLLWSTYLGGSGFEFGGEIAVDRFGNVYISGDTSSTNFPTVHPVQAAYGGGASDAFVAQLNATGTALVYSTYLGGSGDDHGGGVAVDLAGNASVSGYTNSTNFPTVSALQPTYGGGANDAFVAKLNRTGAAVHVTYLGGNGDDGSLGLAVDELANAYVTGYTYSTNFPTANPAQATSGGDKEVFVTRLALDPPTTGPLTFTTPTGSGPNNLTLRRRVSLLGDVVELLNNNVLVAAQALANTTGVQITGAANVADNLTIDNAFGGSVPIGITFDGGAGGGNTLTITATTAADALTLTNSSATFNTFEVISYSNIQTVTASGAANDTATLNDSSGNATLTGVPGSSTLSGTNFSFQVTGYGTVTAVSSAGGSDTATLTGSSGADSLTVAPVTVTLSGSGFSLTTSGFATVTANGNGGSDTANLTGGPGTDTLTATPTTATLSGNGFSLLTAIGFATLTANGSGGSDAATLTGSSGNDTLTASSTTASLSGSSFILTLNSFATLTVNGGGGSDTANLTGSNGADTLTGTLTTATLSGSGFSVTTANFSNVSANGGGGNDSAILTGSNGADMLTGTPTTATLSGSGFSLTVAAFASVSANGNGGNDTAALTGSSGADTLTGTPTTATLSGSGFSLTAASFGTVSANGGGGSDTATLTGSSGADTLTATPTTATLSGNNYSLTAASFASVSANGGGGSDSATFTGSSGADALTVTPGIALLTGSGFSLRVSSFATVTANGNGGSDTATLNGGGSADALTATPATVTWSGSGFSLLTATNFGTLTADGGGGSDAATLTGSNGNDTLTATPTSVTLSGPGFSLRAKNFAEVTANGGHSASATLTGAPGGNIFVGTPSYSTLSGPGFSNTVVGFGNISAGASTSGDSAYLIDGSGNATFRSTPSSGSLTGAGYSISTAGFGTVDARDLEPVPSDLATFADSPGGDLFVEDGTLKYSYLKVGTNFSYVENFKAMQASSSGGDDLALLFGSPGDDTFSSPAPGNTTNSSVLAGPGGSFTNEVDGFLHVRAIANQGGKDTANVQGAPVPSVFRGAPGFSSLTPTSPGYDLLFVGFFTINATAGSSGGDAAYLQDSPGTDSFKARPDTTDSLNYESAGSLSLAQYATVVVQGSAGGDTADLFGRAGMINSFVASPVAPGGILTNVATLSSQGVYSVAVIGFPTVNAHNGSADDLAQLTSAPGDDTGSIFVGTPQSSYLAGANKSYVNLAAGFAHVYATSSGKGTDVALLFGSAGDDTFVGNRDRSYLAGAGYFNQVSNFFKVVASGQGGNDTATLLDSTQNDNFEGLGTTGQVFGTDYVVEADAFSAVAAVTSNGGSDSLYLQMVSYGFSQAGPWRNLQGQGPPPPDSRPFVS
jgi:hypothetical protein